MPLHHAAGPFSPNPAGITALLDAGADIEARDENGKRNAPVSGVRTLPPTLPSSDGADKRLLALCSLPRTNPGNRKEYKRLNGPYQLVEASEADPDLGFMARLMALSLDEIIRVLGEAPVDNPYKGAAAGPA